jgi:hypothetical protein
MLAKSGVVTKQPRAQRTGKRRLLGMLFDMDLKFEVVVEDEIAKTTDPRPLLIVVSFEMGFELVKLAEVCGTLEARVDLVLGSHVLLSFCMLLKDLVT